MTSKGSSEGTTTVWSLSTRLLLPICPLASAFGTVPWIDEPGGYLAVLGTDSGSTAGGAGARNADFVYATLRPLIRQVIAGNVGGL